MPCGSGLEHFWGGGHHLVGFLRGGVWTEVTPGEGAWNGTSTRTFQTLWMDIWIPGAGAKLPPKHPRL